MAGSRIHKFSNIFSRVHGMIKSGVLQYEDKPIWFNVYRTFPPKVTPSYNREPVENQNVISILYPEDLVRAKFYTLYGSPEIQDIADLTDSKTPTICQRFVDKYFELKKSKMVKDEDLFQQTANFLRAEGIRLATEEELNRNKQLVDFAADNISSQVQRRQPPPPVAEEVFGKLIKTKSEDDVMLEND